MAGKPTRAGARTRAEAARVVHAVVAEGRSLDGLLPVADERVQASERSLMRALCYGVLRFHWRLSATIDQLLARPLKPRDRILHSLLAVGLYQLSDTRVSAHAAVGLTVEASRLLKRPQAAGLVNAVLRNQLRSPVSPDEDDIEARWNHPRWIIEQLQTDWPDDWQWIIEANNRQAPMWLRVNSRRSSATDYLARLDGKAEPIAGIDQALKLDSPQAALALPGFEDGDVSVQDAAAQLAAPWLLGGGGRKLLDLCAAPGGKAAHLLELAGPGAVLTAVEVDAGRSKRIEETFRRLGLSADLAVADATRVDAWWDGRPFDGVLLDAPCSASGVIRRHPDIKHLRRPSDIESLAELQARLLDVAWQVLAPGGRLLYVTCSVFRRENDETIAAFLQRHHDALSNLVLPNNNIQALMKPGDHGFQVLPGTADLDGFFFSCLAKKA